MRTLALVLALAAAAGPATAQLPGGSIYDPAIPEKEI